MRLSLAFMLLVSMQAPVAVAGDRCQGGVDAFAKDLHPLLRSHCLPCHDAGGIGPPHSVADVDASYDEMMKFVDFTDLAQSLLVSYGGNFHCRTYPGGSPTCGLDGPTLQTAASAWWQDGQKDCPYQGAFVLAAQALPADLPERGPVFARLRWSLASLGDAFKDVYVELEAQRYSDATADHPASYLFQRPRLATATETVAVQGINVLINGLLVPAADEFASITAVVSPKAFDPAAAVWPFPSLSTSGLMLVGGGPNDTIGVAFTGISVGATPKTCAHLDLFQQDVAPTVDLRCAACHGSARTGAAGREPAVTRLSFAGDDQTVCNAMLQYTDGGPPLQAQLIAYPLRHADGHPLALEGVDDVQPSWTTWITSEHQ